MRTTIASVERATSRAMVDLPVAGRPLEMISMRSLQYEIDYEAFSDFAEKLRHTRLTRSSMAIMPLADLGRDAGLALRLLGRRPTFAAVALLTLALGIGAPAAIFSVVRAVLWRPLPYPDADRLVQFRIEGQ